MADRNALLHLARLAAERPPAWSQGVHNRDALGPCTQRTPHRTPEAVARAGPQLEHTEHSHDSKYALVAGLMRNNACEATQKNWKYKSKQKQQPKPRQTPHTVHIRQDIPLETPGLTLAACVYRHCLAALPGTSGQTSEQTPNKVTQQHTHAWLSQTRDLTNP